MLYPLRDDDYGAVGDPPPPPLHGGIDRVVQQVFGLRGINDALYRREDRYWYTPEWYEEVIIGTDPETGDSIYGEPIVHYAEYHDPDGIFDNQAFYQLSDAQFSVVSVVAAASTKAGATSGTIVADAATRPGPGGPFVAGRSMEINEYEPYGRSRRFMWADFGRDGTKTAQDISDFLAAWYAGSGQADADENGSLGTQDIYTFLAQWFGADPTPADGGGLTAASIDNPYGFCGYSADLETLGINGPDSSGSNGFLYHVRHRVYDPISGRWLTRDPAGFVDGMNLYEYCGGGSVSCFDPMGLACGDEPGDDGRLFTPGKGTGWAETLTPEDKKRLEDIRKRQDGEMGLIGRFLWDATVLVGTIFLEPLDWLATGVEIIKDPGDLRSYAGLLPFVPSAAGKALKINGKIVKAIDNVELLKLTKGNFKENLLRVTGRHVDDVKGLRAHHIVAHGDKRATGARKILQKHGIDVHDPTANGVWLPEKYHGEMHTDKYYEDLEERLRVADKRGGKEEVLNELDRIKAEQIHKALESANETARKK